MSHADMVIPCEWTPTPQSESHSERRKLEDSGQQANALQLC